MFPKSKGSSLVNWLILIIVIFIFFGGDGIPYRCQGSSDSSRASTLISELRNAKAGGIMFFQDNTDLTSADLLSIWPTLNVIGTSFDQYMDNTDKVKQLFFVLVPFAAPNNEPWLMVGKQVSDPRIADQMIGMAGGALYNAAGGAFTRNDDIAFMRVR